MKRIHTLTVLIGFYAVFALIGAQRYGNVPLASAQISVAQAPTVTVRGPIVGGGAQPPTPTVDPAATLAPNPTVTPVAPTTTLTPLPYLNAEVMGVQLEVNLSSDDWAEAMRRVTDNLSVRWIKLQIPWREMQPDSADRVDSEFFRRVEQYIEDANLRGLNVLISVAKAPGWARSVLDEDGPPDNPQALANFLTLMLREISPDQSRGIVGEYIDAIEIWNEPNLRREWQGALPFNGAGYMQLFAPAYTAIRAYSSSMPIITAGLAPTSNSDGSVDDTDYLRQMYAAGLGGYSDVSVGLHPFSWGNAPDAVCCPNPSSGWDDNPHFFFADTVRAYRDLMVANGHGATKMWVTEFGWATWDSYPGDPPTGSEWMRFNDRWDQAAYTIRAFEIFQSTEYFGPAMLWNLNFATLNSMIQNRDERAAYSLVLPGSAGVVDINSADRTERPLYWMIYDAVRPDVQLERYD
ncbi:MAG: cellulase family glycosylhydrolase [Chloroflexota bacterium]|nr:cellulase family glycosylhydrolase [Chloroflexota bacterium]